MISLALLAGCREGFVPSAALTPTLGSEAQANTPVLPTITILPSPAAQPTATVEPALAATATLTAEAPQQEVCSPLEGFTLEQLPGLVSNPYHPPPPGSDDPHAGVDLADRRPGSSVALAGRLVRASLAGQAAAVMADRFPFGNALIVETPLPALQEAYVLRLDLPQASIGPAPHTNLTCPAVEGLAWDTGQRSLYVLYAHLQDPPAYQMGDTLACGQEIGKVGSSGNALNPHLHLEVRVGPAGARLGSLSHYDNRATPAEMAAYCAWSVSGSFQTVDPLSLFLP